MSMRLACFQAKLKVSPLFAFMVASPWILDWWLVVQDHEAYI